MSQQSCSLMQQLKVSCQNCSLSVLCIPRGLSPEDIQKLDTVIKHTRILQRGEYLYHANDPFSSLYALKSGAVKIVSLDEYTHEHIQGLYLTGELIGFDALSTDAHRCSVVALETCHVCEIPIEMLDELDQTIPRFHRQLLRHIGERFNKDNDQTLVNKSSALFRVSSFLLNLSDRFSARGFSPQEFSIYLTRQELGNHLNLTTETVSRLLRNLDRDGVIELQQKRIKILDRSKLEATKELGMKS